METCCADDTGCRPGAPVQRGGGPGGFQFPRCSECGGLHSAAAHCGAGSTGGERAVLTQERGPPGPPAVQLDACVCELKTALFESLGADCRHAAEVQRLAVHHVDLADAAL